jgi:hypothetical protein
MKRGVMPENWRKLYNEELHKLYTSVNTIRVTKSRMGGMGYVKCMGK